MAANNQGIVHLRLNPYGATRGNIACKRTNAHMAVTIDTFGAEPRQCVRCAAKLVKMRALEARRAARSVGA